MKILIVADVEEPRLYERFNPEPFEGVELVISCGDLKSQYLSFITTMLRVPVLYVPGNHDEQYLKEPPEGCDPLDDRIVRVNGLRILGFGGCKSRSPKPYHYTERQMAARVRKRKFDLWRHHGIDILVAHTPAYGIGDEPGTFHEGFECFLPLIDRYQPKYFFHGHQHLDYNLFMPRIQQRGDTTIINAFNYHIVDIDL